jgi:lactam utilization protein B
VIGELRRDRARVVEPVRNRARAEHRRLYEIAKRDQDVAAASMRALANFEDDAAAFFAAAREPGLVRVADIDMPLRATEFASREARRSRSKRKSGSVKRRITQATRKRYAKPAATGTYAYEQAPVKARKRKAGR